MSYKVIKRTTKWSKDDECIMRHEDVLSEFRTLKGAIGFLNKNKVPTKDPNVITRRLIGPASLRNNSGKVLTAPILSVNLRIALARI